MKVYLVGEATAKCGGRPYGIVEADVTADAGTGTRDRGVGVEVNLLVFHLTTEALHDTLSHQQASRPC